MKCLIILVAGTCCSAALLSTTLQPPVKSGNTKNDTSVVSEVTTTVPTPAEVDSITDSHVAESHFNPAVYLTSQPARFPYTNPSPFRAYSPYPLQSSPYTPNPYYPPTNYQLGSPFQPTAGYFGSPYGYQSSQFSRPQFNFPYDYLLNNSLSSPYGSSLYSPNNPFGYPGSSYQLNPYNSFSNNHFNSLYNPHDITSAYNYLNNPYLSPEYSYHPYNQLYNPYETSENDENSNTVDEDGNSPLLANLYGSPFNKQYIANSYDLYSNPYLTSPYNSHLPSSTPNSYLNAFLPSSYNQQSIGLDLYSTTGLTEQHINTPYQTPIYYPSASGDPQVFGK
ncbi:hypothetical protein SK128_007351 [Halocaridina rubra]|uniref:Uncharacterized protein n=1 Tax=Halocaridina rubra TaxID=373956 RepID=A0AAN8WE83_HALRR